MSTLIAGRILHQQSSRASTDCPQVSRWLAVVLFRLHALLMRRYFKIEVSGEHNIPSSGPFILAPLHRSRWDAFLLYCAVTRRFLYFMVSHEEIVGLQGWLMRRMGAFAINTQRPSPSVIRSCKAMISRGNALVVFPEGNLFYYGPGEVHPLKPGIAWLALNFQKALTDENLVIIPVRLVYGDRRLRWGSRAKILVGKPISVSDYSALPGKEGIVALTTTLQNALGEVVNETGSAESLRQCE